MGLQFKFKFGGGVLAINAADEKQLIALVSFWDECPRQCGACQSKNIGMKHRVAQQFDFYELVCKDCGFTYALGQKQDGSGLYPRGNKETGEWEPPYQGNDGGGGGYQQDTRQQQRPPAQQQTRQQTQPAQQNRQPPGRTASGGNNMEGSGWGNQGGGQQNRQPPQRQQGPPPGNQGGLDDDDIPF